MEHTYIHVCYNAIGELRGVSTRLDLQWHAELLALLNGHSSSLAFCAASIYPCAPEPAEGTPHALQQQA